MKKLDLQKRLYLSSVIEEDEDLLSMAKNIKSRGKEYCLGYIIYERFSRPLERILKSDISPFVVYIEIFLIFLVTTVGIGFIANQYIALPSAVMVVLAVASGGFLVVKIGYDFLPPIALKYAIDLPVSDQGKRKMVQWVINSFNLIKQISTTLVFLLILLVSFVLVDIMDENFPVSVSSYIAVVLAGISISQGVYWAIRIPNYGKTLMQFNLNLFSLDPSSSQCVLSFKKAVIKSTLLAGVFFGVSLAVIYWAFQVASNTANIVLIIWYVIGFLIISIFFFYSMSLISKIISKGKLHTLENFQHIIQSKFSEIDDFAKDDFVVLDEMMKLYERIEKTQESVFNIKTISSYMSAIILQALPIVLQVVDISQIILWIKSL
jgi:hypothetical protein